jgi:hypothetical protein
MKIISLATDSDFFYILLEKPEDSCLSTLIHVISRGARFMAQESLIKLVIVEASARSIITKKDNNKL